VDWPAGTVALALDLELSADGRPWLPVSVDGNAPVPFLLQASAGAIAVTGARAAGFGPAGAGRITLQDGLLPGIPGGLFIRQRRLALDALVLGDQSLLLVDTADWPHGQPRRGAAGVLGYDLLRRFVVELDLPGRRLTLYRSHGLDVSGLSDAQRLVVLERTPYFEAWLEPAEGAGRWLRLQFEPGDPVGTCLDADPPEGAVIIAGQRIELADAPCAAPPGARGPAGRDGILGAGGLQALVVVIDYPAGRIAFRAPD
jgi:hypothetical protein